MTRKRDRRPSPPSFGPRKPPPQREGSRAKAERAATPAPRDRPAERREAKVSLIYGFHSVAAALKAPRRELIRLYATAAAAERLGGRNRRARARDQDHGSRGNFRARATRSGPQGSCSRRGRSRRSISRICPRMAWCWFSIRSRTLIMSARFSHRCRLRCRRARHDRAPLARVRRRAGEVGFRRA